MNGRGSSQPGWLLGGAQLAALLLALVVPALLDFGYRLFDSEVLFIMGGAVACGGLLSLLTFRVPLLLRLLFALLVICVLDFYFLASWYAVLLVAVVVVVLVVTRHHATVMQVGALGAALFAVLGVLSPRHSLLAPGLSAPRQAEIAHGGRPLLLHIVLDEQASPLAASAAARAGGRLDRLLASYVRRGFAVQTGVRSDSGATEISLALAFGPPGLPSGELNLLGEGDGFTHRVQRNALLQELVDRQYQVSVIQNSFLQICTVPAAQCQTYSRDNYGHAMRRFEGALGRRLRLVATLMHVEMLQDDARGIFLYRPLGEWAIRRGLVHSDPDRNYWTRPAAMLEIFDGLDTQARVMRPGEAWVAHVLLPHFPYMLDEKCGLRSYAGWSLPTWVTKELALAPLLNRLEADYWQQVECVHARVLSLVDRLDQRLGPTNVRVLIHGDHGARLAKRRIRPKAERLQAATPDASLDTLVLVRAPGMTAGVNADRIRLADSIRSSYDALLR
ncbi:MAG: hypothetical protein IT482_02885 [Gammaproteobacteria bacterium]|nr:hypothetical protein [Gammaproteobacteria bacterium]